MIYVNLLMITLICIAFVYLTFTSLYVFMVALVGSTHQRRTMPPASELRIAILLPCYKEDAIIVDTVQSLVNHDYPSRHYTVFVIADSLQSSTLRRLRALDCECIEVSFPISSKARALHAALNAVPEDQFDVALILDADNVLGQGCLNMVAGAFQSGYRAVQCHRIAKNENTPLALLDAINEEINNGLLRKGQWALGFSATAAGSGMAFDFKLLKEIFNLPHILQINGEDKEIDVQLLNRKIKMAYMDNALVLDEKVASFHAFQKQRLRWVEAYLSYVFRLFNRDTRPAYRCTDFWNKFFQLILLPRSLYFMLMIIAGVAAWVGYLADAPVYGFFSWWWLINTSLYGFALILCCPVNYAKWKTIRSLALLPGILMTMMVTVTKVKPARKEFIHTPKSYTQS